MGEIEYSVSTKWRGAITVNEAREAFELVMLLAQDSGEIIGLSPASVILASKSIGDLAPGGMVGIPFVDTSEKRTDDNVISVTVSCRAVSA